MELGWGGFDRAKLDMLILIRIPFSFHVFTQLSVLCLVALLPRQAESSCLGLARFFVSVLNLHFAIHDGYVR